MYMNILLVFTANSVNAKEYLSFKHGIFFQCTIRCPIFNSKCHILGHTNNELGRYMSIIPSRISGCLATILNPSVIKHEGQFYLFKKPQREKQQYKLNVQMNFVEFMRFKTRTKRKHSQTQWLQFSAVCLTQKWNEMDL